MSNNIHIIPHGNTLYSCKLLQTKTDYYHTASSSSIIRFLIGKQCVIKYIGKQFDVRRQYEEVIRKYPACEQLYVALKEFYKIMFSKKPEKFSKWLDNMKK